MVLKPEFSTVRLHEKIMKKIVFVVGAGASSVFDFPVGSKLIPMVAKYLKDHRKAAISPHIEYKESIDKLRIKLNAPIIPSIDKFIQNHRKEPAIDVCIDGIVESISSAEINFRNTLTDHYSWIDYLFQYLLINVTEDPNDALKADIKFINFNYDRVIEFKFFQGLTALFPDMDNKAASSIVAAFSRKNIVHVYGSLGEFDENDFGRLKLKNFGNKNNIGIRLIGDRYSTEISDIIAGFLNGCDQLHFVGFGYNRENVSLLNLEKVQDIRLVSGTCLGLYESQRNETQHYFWKTLKKRLKLVNNVEDLQPKGHGYDKFQDDVCLRYVKSKVEFEEIATVYHVKSLKTGEINPLHGNHICYFGYKEQGLLKEMKPEQIFKLNQAIEENWISMGCFTPSISA
jgi:hypothetical protein